MTNAARALPPSGPLAAGPGEARALPRPEMFPNVYSGTLLPASLLPPARDSAQRACISGPGHPPRGRTVGLLDGPRPDPALKRNSGGNGPPVGRVTQTQSIVVSAKMPADTLPSEFQSLILDTKGMNKSHLQSPLLFTSKFRRLATELPVKSFARTRVLVELHTLPVFHLDPLNFHELGAMWQCYFDLFQESSRVLQPKIIVSVFARGVGILAEAHEVCRLYGIIVGNIMESTEARNLVTSPSL